MMGKIYKKGDIMDDFATLTVDYVWDNTSHDNFDRVAQREWTG